MKSTAFIFVFLLIAALVPPSCETPVKDSDNVITIGAVLPFSGEHAAVGLNIEQAVSLAVADVNRAGGIAGRLLKLISKDSNSGSSKGYEQAVSLLYDYQVKYLLGPEESNLAKQLVPDIKRQNALNILPSFSAPMIAQTGESGAWLRLAPTPSEVGCAMAYSAFEAGYRTAATIVAPDDYQTLLSAAFNSHFAELGGRSVGSVNIQPDKPSYIDTLSSLDSLNPDVTIMMAYPETAAVITRNWVLSAEEGNWYLSPTLYTEEYLSNVPAGAIEGFAVFSPSLSLESECELLKSDTAEFINCRRNNIDTFAAHYSRAWGGDTPLPASLYYYDAVVLLALTLERLDFLSNNAPSPREILDAVRYVSEKPGITVRWNALDEALDRLAKGEDIAFSGAAAEYDFSTIAGTDLSYGTAYHHVVDVWTVDDNSFKLNTTIGAYCYDKLL